MTAMALEPVIEKLLILQERDIRRDDIRRQLEHIPREIDGFRGRITAEQAVINDAREAVKRLELRRCDIEQRIAKAEDQILRFRTQQLSVKKNEEYSALEKEIETATGTVGQLESEALEAMMEIDEATAAAARKETQGKNTTAELQGHIDRLQANARLFREELAAAEAAVEAAQEAVPPQALAIYRYVKERVKRPPYVTAVEDQRCSGCHIKVSHTTMASLRNPAELSRCETCSRIVFQA